MPRLQPYLCGGRALREAFLSRPDRLRLRQAMSTQHAQRRLSAQNAPAALAKREQRRQAQHSQQHARRPNRGSRVDTQRRDVTAAAAQPIEVDVDRPTEVSGSEALELSDASFHTITLDGCEFLMATTPDGRLDLNDTYVRDTDTDIYARPSSEGDLPATPTRFIEMEWAEEYLGDTLMQKEPWRKVVKVYLVPVTQQEPFRVNIEEVYSVDNAERLVRREAVHRATEETDPTQITLRIRPDGLVIEENRDMIDDWDLVEEYEVQKERDRIAQAEAKKDTAPGLPSRSEDLLLPRDPIDALNDDDREYDETYEDTPEVDQGF